MRAAAMKDAGMKTTLESSMAKLYASEVAVRCANEGVQIHGGYGFIKDYPAEKFYRDVKLCTIGEGTSEIQRLVIARQIAEGLAGIVEAWRFQRHGKMCRLSGLPAPGGASDFTGPEGLALSYA